MFDVTRGSVKRQIEPSAAAIAAAAANIIEGGEDQQVEGGGAGTGMADGVRKRKTTGRTSQFGSSILFGDNVPLPPINEAGVPEDGIPADANWTGSCLMSLTKIPLPDVFETGGEGAEDDEGKLWDRLKSETKLNLTDGPADGIYRVPRSHSLCGWWLCWETQRKHSEDVDVDEMDEMEHFKRSLLKDNKDGENAKEHHLTKFTQRPHLVLIRRCMFLPKSMFDVLMTMMNLSLLKKKSFLVFCLASLIGVLGMYQFLRLSYRTLGIYVPLFFVCDLADSFGIPKSLSAYLLTVYGEWFILIC